MSYYDGTGFPVKEKGEKGEKIDLLVAFSGLVLLGTSKNKKFVGAIKPAMEHTKFQKKSRVGRRRL